MIVSAVGTLAQPGGGGQAAATPLQSKTFRNIDFVDTIIQYVLCDLRFSLNNQPKSADDK
jgi:hypothetical protein